MADGNTIVNLFASKTIIIIVVHIEFLCAWAQAAFIPPELKNTLSKSLPVFAFQILFISTRRRFPFLSLFLRYRIKFTSFSQAYGPASDPVSFNVPVVIAAHLATLTLFSFTPLITALPKTFLQLKKIHCEITRWYQNIIWYWVFFSFILFSIGFVIIKTT